MFWFKRRYYYNTRLPVIKDLYRFEIQSMINTVLNRMKLNKTNETLQELYVVYLYELLDKYPKYLSKEIIRMLNVTRPYYMSNDKILDIISHFTYIYAVKQYNTRM